MSRKMASQPATLERFIQTQEDFQELGEYLTDASSVQSVASSKIHGSHKEKVSNRPPGYNKIDQRGDHYNSTAVPDTQSFAGIRQCPSTIYIKLRTSQSFSQPRRKKGDGKSTRCLCTERDECSDEYSQASLSMSEMEDCVPCDEVYDWKDSECEVDRSRSIPSKMSRSKIKSGSVVPYSDTAKPLVPKSSATKQMVSMPKKPAITTFTTEEGLVIAQVRPTSGVTITEITSSPSMKVLDSKQLAVMQMDPSQRSVIPLGIVVEATEVHTAKKVLVKGASEHNLGPGRRPDKVTRIVRRAASDSNVARVIRVQNQLDLKAIRTESKIALVASLSKILKPGIGGLKEFISSRHLSAVKEGEQPQLNSFIDYFVQCDGLRYLGILEQIELDFEQRCKAGLLYAQPNTDKRAVYLRHKLAEIAEVQPVYQQQDLKSFNFPNRLQDEIIAFPVSYQPKIEAITKIHDFGLQMESYWYNEMQNGKQVNPTEIYDIATQMLAELMGQVFSILVKLCEYLVIVNVEAKKYRKRYTIENLIALFTNIRMLTVDEVGAVGETFGEVMMRISRLKKEVIYDLMTKLYSQINFVDISICRALRAVVPLILHYDIQLHRRNQ